MVRAAGRAEIEASLLARFAPPHLTDKPAWRPHAHNVFQVPAVDVSFGERDARITLTRSRWEGCAVRVWRDWVSVGGDTATVTIRNPQSPCRVTDGRREDWITPQELWQDRRNPKPEQCPPWIIPPLWFPGGNNTIIVPGDDVTENPSGRSHKVTLTRSRWEGLHFDVPNFRVETLETGEARVTLGHNHPHITLRGAEQPLVVSAREMFWDRAQPLTEPGPSLAVEQVPWIQLNILGRHVQVRKTRSGPRAHVKFPRWAQKWPGASVWLPRGFLTDHEPDWRLLRLPEAWTVKISAPGADPIDVTAAEFIALAEGWAMTTPAPTHGVQVRDPIKLPPVGKVVIPDELLDR